MVRLFEFEALCRPHLMLADFGRDVDLTPTGQRIQTVDRIAA
jgi:hypothetical protein